MLGVWKGVPYAKRLCWSYDLGKVKDEEHLFFICPNTQKVREHFCSTLPFTHTSTLVELMQTTNTVALAKFVACCQYQRTICPPWSTFHLMDSLVPNERKIGDSKQEINIIWVYHFPFTLWLHTSLHRKYPITTFHHEYHKPTIAQLIPKINIFLENFSIYSNWWSSAGSCRKVKIIHKKIYQIWL